MTAFEQLRLLAKGDMILPVRLIGISLQNISVSGSRQLTIADIYGHREQLLEARWEKAIQKLEWKYGVKVNSESRDRIYDVISAMEKR